MNYFARQDSKTARPPDSRILWLSFCLAGDARTARLRTQSGQALLITMLAAACLLPLGAFAAMQARLDYLIQHHTRTALETYVIAESGLEHALADFAADARFERLLAGPDRQAGTGDDGEYPFAEPPPAFFPHEPFRYEVRVAAQSADDLEIRARGYGPFGATRMVVATVRRSALPYLPGAVSLALPEVDVALGADFRVNGVEASPGDPGLPALALDGAAAAGALAARLPAGAAAQLVGRGGSPSIAGAALPSAEALADVAGRRAEAHGLGADVSGALGEGLFVSPTSLRLVDASGSGILIVNGALELSGTSSFAGLIVALGDVRLDPTGSAAIDGGLMMGRSGRVLALRGGGHIAYDARVIAQIDAMFAGLLPRAARVTGWRERAEESL